MFSELGIYPQTDSVYLGNCLGLDFQSQSGPRGQTAAEPFSSVKEAKEGTFQLLGSQSRHPLQTLPDLKFFRLPLSESGFATIEECMAAGLPAWTKPTGGSSPTMKRFPRGYYRLENGAGSASSPRHGRNHPCPQHRR